MIAPTTRRGDNLSLGIRKWANTPAHNGNVVMTTPACPAVVLY